MPRLAIRRRAAAAAQDEAGATVLEFALVAPVLIMMLLGLCDMAHTLYMTAALQGVVQQVARNSTLQIYSTAAGEATLDATVIAQVKALDAAAVPVPVRRYYRDYAKAAAKQAEAFTDTNNDGTCDNNESFTDSNNNGVWDKDGGDAGGGGAQDRTVYTVTVTYPRLFPIDKFIPTMKNPVVLVATTVLTNQPYGDQASYTTATTGHCT